MNTCDKCGSNRVAEIFAHSKDLSSFVCPADGIYAEDTYFPEVKGICGGDDLDISLCLECGKVQGTFPIKIDVPDGIPLARIIIRIEQELEWDEESEFSQDDLEILHTIRRIILGSNMYNDFLEEDELEDHFEVDEIELIKLVLEKE